jgi:hypothetical protein
MVLVDTTLIKAIIPVIIRSAPIPKTTIPIIRFKTVAL